MKINWILASLVTGIIGGFITYFLCEDVYISVLGAVSISVLVLIHNPITRYIRAFYVVLLPLLCNIYFSISSNTKNFDIKAGLEKIDKTTTIILGVIAAICLLLDYLERIGKFNGTFLSFRKNNMGDINGSGNTINQNNA